MIKLEADLADMTRLLFAEQIAGAANVEVVRGKREAGTQRIERLQNLQTLLGTFREFLSRRRGDIGISARLGTTDPAAKLIELGKAEHIGAMYDQRVRIRHVEAGLDDRSRKQDVVFALVERRHHVLELRRRHLTRGPGEDEIGHSLAQKLGNVVEI